MILGADPLAYEELRSLLTDAERELIRVFLFFERFRQHATELAGGAVAFLRLENHAEAEEASRFISTVERWVPAKRAVTVGESHAHSTESSRTSSASAGVGVLPVGGTLSASHTRGSSRGETSERSVAHTEEQQWESDAVVKPGELRVLQNAELIYVEPRAAGAPPHTRVTCDPEVASGPRVSGEPRVADDKEPSSRHV